MNEEILRVTPDGEFIWHNNADKLIETGDFSGSPSAPHILRRLRRLSAVEAQRDALLEALRPFAKNKYTIGFTHEDVDHADAAIKAVEGEKT